jgi:hypothetical protein
MPPDESFHLMSGQSMSNKYGDDSQMKIKWDESSQKVIWTRGGEAKANPRTLGGISMELPTQPKQR